MPRNIPRRTFLALASAATAVGIDKAGLLCSNSASKNSNVQEGTVQVSHQREFRGVWVATVLNLDWPSQPGLSVEEQKSELIEILDRIQALNFNAIILQIRPTGDAFYQSELEPWSYWLTGEQGKAPEPFYDPLEFAIAESHKRNIELHAWFNPYRAGKNLPNGDIMKTVAPHISVTHPEYVYQYGSEQWMDPGAKVVQDQLYNVILDVVHRYDIDGVHMDDYFYPYPEYIKNPDVKSSEQHRPFPDDKTYESYQQLGGKLSKADWRRENVNKIIQRLSVGIRATKEHVKFGISPFGIYRPGQPPGIFADIDPYEDLHSDPKKWLEEGWVDYLAPQLYWKIEPPQQSYPVLLKWWTENNPKKRHIYPGIALYKIKTQNWPIAECEKQVEITRSLAPQLALGNIFFRMNFFNDSDVFSAFKNSTYAEPALAPAMPWKKSRFPVIPPTIIGIKDGKLTWKATNNRKIRSWTLYRQVDGIWKLLKILDAGTTEVKVEPGIYALCTVDRLLNESGGIKISVN
jgi:uncharacterized lipoprotein YddW (UPF0748 family)